MQDVEQRAGVIGGTGFSEHAQDLEVIETDYGDVEVGHLDLGGKDVRFIARHQKLEIPSFVNYRANVEALKIVGVNTVFTVSAAGRMAEDVHVGNLVNLDDLVYQSTGQRETTFAEKGALILHAPLTNIFSRGLREIVNNSWDKARSRVTQIYSGTPLEVGFHTDGVYFNSEAPWFNTEAQEAWLRNTIPNVKLIGQTKIPESPLLRELAMAEVSLGACTDNSTFPGADRGTHAGEGGVMDVAHITARAAFAVLDEAIRVMPTDFHDMAHDMLRSSVDLSQVDMQLLKERRPKLAVIIEEAFHAPSN